MLLYNQENIQASYSPQPLFEQKTSSSSSKRLKSLTKNNISFLRHIGLKVKTTK